MVVAEIKVIPDLRNESCLDKVYKLLITNYYMKLIQSAFNCPSCGETTFLGYTHTDKYGREVCSNCIHKETTKYKSLINKKFRDFE